MKGKPTTTPPPFVVAIAGFDPSCGAGVVADARSIEAMGAMPLAVVTATTVQAGRGVKSFRPVAPAHVLAQLDELLKRLPVAAVKIGQVPSAACARVLAGALRRAGLPLVLDPVLVATGGASLVGRGTAAAIANSLLPLATLVTVNLAEARVLAGLRVADLEGMKRAARVLVEMGAGAVLVKGGHLPGDPVDLLRCGGRDILLRSPRIPGSMHGTGCALASAVAARLACGDDLVPAVRAARAHVRRLLGAAVGSGRGRLRAPSSY
ncbi:MAG: bifunctional hydroxymethylpyrimidine kinase/phosphomethylpyrimidine kinase [Candidatus Binatia bacterium]